MKKLLKIIGLISLCVGGFSVLAQFNPCKIDPTRCQMGGLFGVWEFMKVTLHDDPEIGLGPFPKSITIEMTEPDQGKLTLQLRTQSKVKTYPFSKTEPTTQKSAQVYDKPDATFEFKPYTLEEIAIISYSANALKIDLKWNKKNENDEIEWAVPGSYTFALDGDILIFYRTNDKDVPAEERVQTRYEAHYRISQL